VKVGAVSNTHPTLVLSTLGQVISFFEKPPRQVPYKSCK